jgi:hypothetical protein
VSNQQQPLFVGRTGLDKGVDPVQNGVDLMVVAGQLLCLEGGQHVGLASDARGGELRDEGGPTGVHPSARSIELPDGEHPYRPTVKERHGLPWGSPNAGGTKSP